MSTELNATDELKQLQYDLDVAVTAYEAAMAAMAEAVRAGESNLKSTAYIADAVAALNQAQSQVQDVIPKVAVARGAAKTAAYHPASVAAQGKAVVGVIKQIATMEKALLKADSLVDTMVNKLSTKELAQSDQEIAYERGWAQLASKAAALEADLATMLPALQTMKTQALAAALKGRQGSLELAQDDAKSIAVDDWVRRHGDAAKARDALKELQSRIGSDARQAALSDLRKARMALDRLEGQGAAMKQLRKDIAATKLQPLDVAKLARKLGVPDKLRDMLAKALAKPEPQQPKALDAVIAAAGLTLTGKGILKLLAEGKLL